MTIWVVALDRECFFFKISLTLISGARLSGIIEHAAVGFNITV